MGTQFGIIISQPTTTSGINATNQGTMTWNNALPNGIGLRSTVMLGYYTNNNLTSATFTNDTAGQIFVNGTVNLPDGYSTGGISVGARYGTAILDNKGSVTSTSTSTNGLGYAVGLAAMGKNAQITNSGSVIVTANQGSSAAGIGINGSWTTGTTSINNSGTVTISALGADTRALVISALTTSATSAIKLLIVER